MKKREENEGSKAAKGATLYSRNKSKKTKRKKAFDLTKSKNREYFNRATDPENEDRVITYLAQNGIEVGSYKKRYILRRLRVRMGRLKINSYKEYLNYLQKHANELSEIQESLSINVTRFFRNRDTFEKLKKDILPSLIRKQNSIKIWSAGCAVGAEPYSLAMIATDIAPKSVKISIIATDVKEELLRQARYGVYTPPYLEELTESEISRYFTETASGDFKVKSNIKNMVNFSQQDLMKDQYPRNIDMIVCRNVLIYVDRKAQNVILNQFFNALKPGGIVVLGRTETLFGDWRSSVDIISTKHRIYKRKENALDAVKINDDVKKLQSQNRKIKSLSTINSDRLQELKDFRKTFEERRAMWEKRLDKKETRTINPRRTTTRNLRDSNTTSTTRSSKTRPTRSSTLSSNSDRKEELDKVKKSGSLSDYRKLLKKSSEPTRVSRIRRDLDR